MSDNGKLVPEIRFKGFSDAWVQRKLGEVVEFYSGLTYSPDNVIESDDGTFVLRSSNVNNGEIVNADNVYVNSNAVNCRNVEIGDVIVVVRNGSRNLIGKHAQIKNKMSNTVIGAFMTGIRSEQSELINALLDTPQFDIEITKNLGATINQITIGAFKQMTFSIPCEKAEQTAIGKFFHTLDNLITSNQRKLDGLKELKKGYLQQMFPQAGERVPRIRFAGFSGDWQERRLGELFTERSERSAEGELISVTINSGVIKASSLERKDNSSEDKSNYKKVEIGDIAYNSMRMWQGASGVSCFTGILSPAYTVIIPNNDVCSVFFSYMFKLTKMIQVFQSSSQGLTSDTWNLKFPLLKNISVLLPCYSEQTIIGSFFQSLDKQIAVQAQKIDNLKSLKSAYLQKMFI